MKRGTLQEELTEVEEKYKRKLQTLETEKVAKHCLNIVKVF